MVLVWRRCGRAWRPGFSARRVGRSGALGIGETSRPRRNPSGIIASGLGVGDRLNCRRRRATIAYRRSRGGGGERGARNGCAGGSAVGGAEADRACAGGSPGNTPCAVSIAMRVGLRRADMATGRIGLAQDRGPAPDSRSERPGELERVRAAGCAGSLVGTTTAPPSLDRPRVFEIAENDIDLGNEFRAGGRLDRPHGEASA